MKDGGELDKIAWIWKRYGKKRIKKKKKFTDYIYTIQADKYSPRFMVQRQRQ